MSIIKCHIALKMGIDPSVCCLPYSNLVMNVSMNHIRCIHYFLYNKYNFGVMLLAGYPEFQTVIVNVVP
jgi:hypothetical protein